MLMLYLFFQVPRILLPTLKTLEDEEFAPMASMTTNQPSYSTASTNFPVTCGSRECCGSESPVHAPPPAVCLLFRNRLDVSG